MTISLGSIKNFLYQCNPTYTRQVSSHRVLYLKFLSTYNLLLLCIIYLHVTEGCLKVMFYFCYSKNRSDVMKNIFNSFPIYF